MNAQDVKTVTLTINAEQARAKLNDLAARLDTLKQKREEALNKGNADGLKTYTQEIKRIENQMARINTRANTVERTLKSLDKATPNELKKTIKEIGKELNSGNVERGSREWNTLTEALKKAKAELNKINTEQKAAESSFGSNFGKKWAGLTTIIEQAQSAFSSAMSSAMNYVNEFAEMDEHMSNVRKYTGLSTEAVNELNDSFKQMDTRTARTALNDLAGDAGRLGLTSKEDILDFVAAADQINVALGEDLGEDAVKNIGKLAQLFGDADSMGLKQAMLSTGSVINELAQSSSASEGYLMEFTARLAGVGNQAGMTQAQVMAFGSILDQSMVNVEKGATALQNTITAIFRDPAKMAKTAGLNVQEFTNLLKTDANAAIIQFIQALNNTGGLDKLAPALKEMNLSGAGVTQTLSALAQNVNALKATQEQATKAFQDGTSVTNEFNTANNTTQARLEKAQQRLQDVRIELGEQLLPLASRGLNATALATQYVAKLIPFLAAHGRELTTLAIVIATYTTAMHLAALRTAAVTIAQKTLNIAITAGRTIAATAQATWLLLSSTYYTLTGNVVKARAAHIAFHRTLLANPYAAVLTAIVAIGAAVYLWATRTERLTAAQIKQKAAREAVASVEAEAAKSYSTETTRIQNLTRIILDSSKSVDTRRAAISALQAIIPAYHGSISKTGQLYNNNIGVVNNYIEKLKQLSIAQAIQDKMTELASQKIEAQLKLQEAQNNLKTKEAQQKKNNKAPVAQYATGSFAGANTVTVGQAISSGVEVAAARGKVKEAQTAIAKLNAQDKALTDYAKTLGTAFDNAVIAGTNTSTTSGTTTHTNTATTNAGDLTTEETDRLAQIRQKTAELDEQQRKEEAHAAVDNVTGVTTYLQYREQLLAIDNKYLKQKRALYKEGDSEITTIDKQLAENEKKNVTEKKDWSLNQIDTETEAQLQALEERHLKERTDEEQYQREKEALEEQRLKRRVAYLKNPTNGADPQALYEAQKALEDKQNENTLNQKKRLYEKVEAFRKEYLQTSLEEQENLELKYAEELKSRGLISVEEYEKAKSEIQEKYKAQKEEADKKSSKEDKQTNTLGQPTDELSNSIISAAQALNNLHEKLKNGEATWQDYAAVAIAALSSVSATLSAASSLSQANSQLEQAQVTARYDAEIEAAGSTTAKGKKLEEQKQKELAAIKTKYNNKQMKVEIAQATAQVAVNALKAYAAMADIPVVGPALAAVAAAAAVAAGAIQIATIKKQHAAEAAGYYEGGFTGGNSYRQEAGIVHEGEFVANHEAVNNPNVLPVLRLIDQAQRANRVASLTAADVSRAIAAPLATANNTSQATTTVKVVDTTAAQTAQALNRLTAQLDTGLAAYVTLDGPNGLAKQWKRYNKMSTK